MPEVQVKLSALWVARHGPALVDARPSGESLGEHRRGALLFVFTLVGLPTYAGMYDKFLIAVGLVMNAATIWLAWNWQA